MRLGILGIEDRGVPNKERLYLAVLVSTNLSYYAVLDTEYTSDGRVVAIPKHAYWFGPRQVNPGDQVILYTGSGTDTSFNRLDGHTDHVMYWGLPSTLWNKSSGCAVLFEISSWETFPSK
jgi:hypothetical protein